MPLVTTCEVLVWSFFRSSSVTPAWAMPAAMTPATTVVINRFIGFLPLQSKAPPVCREQEKRQAACIIEGRALRRNCTMVVGGRRGPRGPGRPEGHPVAPCTSSGFCPLPSVRWGAILRRALVGAQRGASTRTGPAGHPTGAGVRRASEIGDSRRQRPAETGAKQKRGADPAGRRLRMRLDRVGIRPRPCPRSRHPVRAWSRGGRGSADRPDAAPSLRNARRFRWRWSCARCRPRPARSRSGAP